MRNWLLTIVAALALGPCAWAQNGRYDSQAFTTFTTIGNTGAVKVVPGATITIWNRPTPQTTQCSAGGCVAATTYTNNTTTTSCAAATPVVLALTTTCTGTADSFGNFGFWAAPGSYQYCVAAAGVTTQCYNVILPTDNTSQVNPKQVGACDFYVGAGNPQGWAGADAGAWINAADAALTTACGTGIQGRIHLQGALSATTSITVGVRHTLDVAGGLVYTPPLLMSDGANVDCNHLRGSGGGATVNTGLVANAGAASMIRGVTQDGTTEMFTLQRCQLDAAFQTITTGVIDTTGMNDRTTVRDVEIIHWNGTAPAIFVGNAASNSTSFQHFSNIWVNGGGTASSSQPCLTIRITGSGVNGSIIGLTFDHIECTSGGTATLTQAVLIQNNSSTANANALSNIYLNDISLQYSGVTVTDAIKVDQAWNIVFKNTHCANGTITNCLHVTNNTNNVGIVSDNLTWGLGGSITNFVLDDLNTITLPVTGGYTHVPHYEFYNNSSSHAFAVFGSHYSFLETSAPTTPIFGTGRDACYGDSTLHALKCSYNNGTFFQIPQVIAATSSAFATATTAGTCVQNVTAVTGAATSMAVSISPVSTPGVGAVWSAFVSSSNNVTINECAVATSAGGTIAFNIRVTP